MVSRIPGRAGLSKSRRFNQRCLQPPLGTVLAVLLGLCLSQPGWAEYDLAITNVTVIGTHTASARAVPNQTVYISGERIAAVRESAADSVNAGTVIDGKNRFLIPGLWDMHVHVVYEPRLTSRMADLFLDHGITSVRDTGGLLAQLLPEIQKWRAPQTVAPSIYFSGPLLDGALVVYDGDARPAIGRANPTVRSAAASVKTLVKAGVDFIKIYELVSPDVFAVLVQAANEHKLPIAAHVPLALAADQAGAKVNSMEHLRNVELACADDADALLTARRRLLAAPEQATGHALRAGLHAAFRPRALATADVQSSRCQKVISALAQTIQVPTLRLNTISQYPPVARADWGQQLNQLPRELALSWQQTANSFVGRATPDQIKMAQWSMDLVTQMHRQGVPIGAGTDTPIGQAIPGYSLHTELERLVAAGLSPGAALHSATVIPAQFFGLQHQQGSITEGHVADLVLLDKNPLADIKNSRSIVAVISRGQRVR